MIIRVSDVRKAGFCVRGLREWGRLNGFDFNDFVKNGIHVDRLEHLDDAMAKRVIEHKKKREVE